ncbi:hypothetical protein B9T07_08300 [Limnospira fusiformis CCALA 023]|nr:hypothetical protein AP285_28330 [Arthrospira platensis YZ]KDR54998.1 hypothetical protein APPUASWS_026140 [Arthrospira platensis str. Paraca]BAI94197.1 hypothetical protein NIES39_Q01890 [Arthrospira platensis NIES-39]
MDGGTESQPAINPNMAIKLQVDFRKFAFMNFLTDNYLKLPPNYRLSSQQESQGIDTIANVYLINR